MQLPQLTANHPRMGNRFSRWLGRQMLRLYGWRVDGQFLDAKQQVIAVAPHTSNWDFFIGMAAMLAMGIKVSWLAKHSVFVWPVRGLLFSLGGVEVNRKDPRGMAEQVAARFRAEDKLIVTITPEGTRKQVSKWKSGFLRIARAAGVPVALVAFDYPNKTIHLGPHFWPGEDIDADLAWVRDYFRQFHGRHHQVIP